MGQVIDPTDHTHTLESMLERGRIEPGEYTVNEVLFVPGHAPQLVLEQSTIETTEEIARVCHEANRALQVIQNDPTIPVSKPWDEESDDQKVSVELGVQGILDGNSAAESHAAWCDHKLAAGWTFGDVKDEKAKTHPLLVPYEDLPPEARLKDVLFSAIVRALAGGA